MYTELKTQNMSQNERNQNGKSQYTRSQNNLTQNKSQNERNQNAKSQTERSQNYRH